MFRAISSNKKTLSRRFNEKGLTNTMGTLKWLNKLSHIQSGSYLSFETNGCYTTTTSLSLDA
jgi:hypothetical protein